MSGPAPINNSVNQGSVDPASSVSAQAAAPAAGVQGADVAQAKKVGQTTTTTTIQAQILKQEQLAVQESDAAKQKELERSMARAAQVKNKI
jgi:hypothetical protein